MTTSSPRGSATGSSSDRVMAAQPGRPSAPSAAMLPRNSRRVFISASPGDRVEVVLLDAARETVALALEQGANLAALGFLEVVLDRQRADAIAAEIQAFQRLQLRALDVDAHVVDERGRFRAREELGERVSLELDDRGVERRLLPAAQVLFDSPEVSRLAETHAFAAGAVDDIREHGAAPCRHVPRKRVDAHAFPSQILQHLGVGILHPVRGPHVDEEPLAQPGEGLEDDPPVLAAGRPESHHAREPQSVRQETLHKRHLPAIAVLRPRGERREERGGERREPDLRPPRRPHQPRPMNGILVAMMVMNCTLVSSGRFAMCSTAAPTWSTSISGSGRISPFACGTPSAMREASGVRALPMSICPTLMSYFLPSSALALVRPVTACFVEVYGAEFGRGACAEIEPLLMMRPPRGVWLFMILNASWVHRNMPVRLVFTTFCHCSSVRSSSRILPGVPIPALLNSTSSRPNFPFVAANSACTAFASVTSVGATSARSPAPDIFPVSSSRSTRLPASATP